MGAQTMEVMLISARGLNNTSWLPRMAYAAAWISSDYRNKQQTPVDSDHDATDPTWNHVMKFTLHDAAALQQRRLLLEIVIYRNATFGDKEIGRVSLLCNEIFKHTISAVDVVPQGSLIFSAKLQQLAVTAGSSVTGCRPAGSSSYPPANRRSAPTNPRQTAFHPTFEMESSVTVSYDAEFDDGDYDYDVDCDFSLDF